MGVKLNIIKCPACDANLEIEEGRDRIFCTYCGAQVIVTNENEYIYRHIDEAEIKQAETDRIIKLKQLEIDSQKNSDKRILTIILIISISIFSVLGVIGFCFDSVGLMMCLMIAIILSSFGTIFGADNNSKTNHKKMVGKDDVIISEIMDDYNDKNYNSILMIYKSAGFQNINAIPMNDLNIFTMKNNEKVDSVSINGDDDFEEGDVFPKSSNVVITYHSSKYYTRNEG